MPDYRWVTESIFTVADFFTADECLSCVRLAESAGFTAAPIDSAFGAELRPDVRNNSRVIVDDVAQATDLWRRSLDYVPMAQGDWRAVGVNERFRYYRYEIGQQFEWHRDGAYERPNGERSRLTFMIYLNDDFEGGQTSFEDEVIVPERGLALFFDHRLLHKGQPVTAGRKYVLRTDVMYRWQREPTG